MFEELNLSQEEVEEKKQEFISTRPKVTEKLVKILWSIWRLRDIDDSFFGDKINDLALVLHAQAYGEQIPKRGSDNYIGRLLKEKSKEFSPISFPVLTLGPRATLSGEVVTSFDSHILHAWIFKEGKMARRVLIIGKGIPEIYLKVYTLSVHAAIRIFGGAKDMMGIGALSIELPGYARVPLDIPFNVFGDKSIPLEGDAAQTAEQVMGEFVGNLRKIAQETGMLQIHEVERQEAENLFLQLYAYAERDLQEEVIIWAPGAKKEQREQALSTVSMEPYWYLGEKRKPLNLEFSSELLSTRSCMQLIESFWMASVYKWLMDVQIRKEFYDKEKKTLEESLKRWNELENDEDQRLAIWGPTQEINSEFDFGTGIVIPLLETEFITTEEYFLQNVPKLIKSYDTWKKRMEQIEESIHSAYERKDAPMMRFAVSRYIDAVLRQRKPEKGDLVEAAFERWRKEIEPVLCFEWKQKIKELGVDSQRIFTSHTIFQTFFTMNDGFILQPYSIFDSRHSIAVFDEENTVSIVIDPSDYPEWKSIPEQQSAEKEEDLSFQIAMLDNLAEDPETDFAQFYNSLEKIFQENPKEVTQHILKRLTESIYENSHSARATETERIDQLLASSMKANLLRRSFHMARVAAVSGALVTARQHLEAINLSTLETKMIARLHLLQVFVEWSCSDSLEEGDEEFATYVKRLFHSGTFDHSNKAQVSLEKAINAHSEYVENWIKKLDDWKTEAAIGDLFRTLPKIADNCSIQAQATLVAMQAAEVMYLARKIKGAYLKVPEVREALTNVLVRTGLELESALLPEYASTSGRLIQEMFALLTGQVHIRR